MVNVLETLTFTRIKREREKPSSMEEQQCIFCRIAQGELQSWKVFENDQVFAFFDIHPVARYHTLVVPKDHYTNIFDIPEDILKEVIAVVRHLARLYKEKLGIENVQIINNSGKAAQQDVFHLHFHIMPREEGDGQNIRWKTHAEYVADFDKMIDRLS
jgi:histidine triad (HIT) family protein